MAFLVRESSGIVCVAMTGARLDELRVPPMDGDAADPGGSAFAVSVDLRVGITTGISAADRALTVRALADPATGPTDIVRPGHLLPLRVRDGGVLDRARPAEAAVDLCRGAGLAPAAVLAAAVDGAGELADPAALAALAERHDLVLLAVSEVLADRRRREPPVRPAATTALPTPHGRFRAVGYGPAAGAAAGPGPGPSGHDEHLALVRGDPAAGAGPVLVAVHRECVLGDVFGSLRCGCAARLAAALAAIDAAGRGVLVYLRSTHAFARPAARPTAAANPTGCGAPDERRDAVAAHVLRDLGVGPAGAVLLSDDPGEPARLTGCGLAVTGRRPLLGAAEADVV
jgi:3,4-dihydroxy 2-butanone 4-phosphate synthase / GTP cyclohydrolase II